MITFQIGHSRSEAEERTDLADNWIPDYDAATAAGAALASL
ncbi:hypothetical protein [Mycobacteroides chelonae]|nr:hypothetical protein [Mycobacteroides chelonae]